MASSVTFNIKFKVIIIVSKGLCDPRTHVQFQFFVLLAFTALLPLLLLL